MIDVHKEVGSANICTKIHLVRFYGHLLIFSQSTTTWAAWVKRWIVSSGNVAQSHLLLRLMKEGNATNSSTSMISTWFCKNSMNNLGKTSNNDMSSYEFGGPLGVTAMMTGFPVLMYYLWICLWFYDGKLVYPTSVDDITPFFWRMWEHVRVVGRVPIFVLRVNDAWRHSRTLAPIFTRGRSTRAAFSINYSLRK